MALAGTAKVGDALIIAQGIELIVPDTPPRLPITLQINTDVIRLRRMTKNRVEIRITRGQPVPPQLRRRDLRPCEQTESQSR